MKNNHKTVLFTLLALSMTACIKEGYDYDNCPGEFTILPVSPGGEGINLDDMHTTIITPDGTSRPIDIGKDNPIDLDEGDYTITTTGGNTDHVTINGNTVSVETDADNNPKEPGDFSGGYVDITIGPNADENQNTHQIPVSQQTRPLIIKVIFKGNNLSLVEAVNGTVDGIALSRDLNNGFPPTDGKPRHPVHKSGSMAYGFSKTGTGGGQEFLSETRRLLGIDGDAEQQLALDILFTGQMRKEYNFNIARAMDEFHITDVSKPWTIEITIHLGADFNATIEDWKAGPDIWMDAQH